MPATTKATTILAIDLGKYKPVACTDKPAASAVRFEALTTSQANLRRRTSLRPVPSAAKSARLASHDCFATGDNVWASRARSQRPSACLPDPNGAYANASGKVTTRYVKGLYTIDGGSFTYWGYTSLSVTGLEPSQPYILVSYSGLVTGSIGFWTDFHGTCAFKDVFNGETSGARFRFALYEVWLADFDQSGELVPVAPVLTSDPKLSGWW